MVNSTIWIATIGAAVSAVLVVAYIPNLFILPKDVSQLQTGGQVQHELTVGQEGSFRGLAKGGKLPYQFEWAFPDGSTVRNVNATHAFLSPGTYEVTVSISDASGQTGHHSFRIEVSPAQ